MSPFLGRSHTLCTAAVTPGQYVLLVNVCIETWWFPQFQTRVYNCLLDINCNSTRPKSNALSVPQILFLLTCISQINTLPSSQRSGMRFQSSLIPPVFPSPATPPNTHQIQLFQNILTSLSSFLFLCYFCSSEPGGMWYGWKHGGFGGWQKVRFLSKYLKSYR